MNEQLKSYITENIKKGISKEEIKKSLLTAGWKEEDIDAAFVQLEPFSQRSYKQESQRNGKILTQETRISSFASMTKLLLAVVFLVIFGIGVIMLLGSRFNFLASSKVKRSSTVSIELHEKYLPIWQQLFIDGNQITQDYFTKHIFPRETSMNIKGELGEQFYIKYDFKIDWVTMSLKDGIVIKPSEEDHYLSLEELSERASRGKRTDVDACGGTTFSEEFEKGLYYQINRIVMAENIISKKEAKKKFLSCYPGIKPAPRPFAIEDYFSSKLCNKKWRLLYRGVVKLENKNFKLAEVDLATGETECNEVPSLQSEVPDIS